MRTFIVQIHRTVACGLISLALAGMAGCLPGSAQEGVPIEGTSWVLESLGSSAPLEGTKITAQFAQGRIMGSAGCNSYGASYALRSDQFEVAEIESTLMLCLGPPGVMEQETRYLDTLRQVDRVEIREGKLILAEGSDSRLIFAGPD